MTKFIRNIFDCFIRLLDNWLTQYPNMYQGNYKRGHILKVCYLYAKSGVAVI